MIIVRKFTAAPEDKILFPDLEIGDEYTVVIIPVKAPVVVDPANQDVSLPELAEGEHLTSQEAILAARKADLIAKGFDTDPETGISFF